MLRRDFVRALIAAGIAPKALLAQQSANPAPPPPAPVPWMLGLSPKTPLPQIESAAEMAETELEFFTPLQMRTLQRLSDVLVPPIGEKPGALRAQTPIFLDFLMVDSSPERQRVYTEGLDWLEGESRQKFGKPFGQLDNEQADSLLRPWLRTWMNDHPPAEAHADFVNIAHDDIRLATVNSKAWSEAASEGAEENTAETLYWSPIEPDTHFESTHCASVPPHVRAVPSADHPMPTYSR